MLIDTHCHLDPSYFAEGAAAVMARARAEGVSGFVTIGVGRDLDPARRAVALAESCPDVWATVGVHPHEAAELDAEGRELLLGWLARPGVVAVGECGLDYHYMRSPREVQREALAWQLAQARERALPVSLHVRGDEPDAFGELLGLWRSEGGGALEGVLHCYTGTLEFARRALDQGLCISFSGILTFKRDRGLREVARALPLDRLLVETDAPYLLPRDLDPKPHGRRNEPQFLPHVLARVAALKEQPVDVVARATTANAERLFGLSAA